MGKRSELGRTLAKTKLIFCGSAFALFKIFDNMLNDI